MNLQEVNNISITEGTVRTIHDNNGKLLWGKLTYSTTYDGDTEQDGTPTPDSPVDVDVVTGTQTVTISDGTNTGSFTVNLGSTELCKIGTYQDYIYKSGDDWYLHKETVKEVFDGTEEWNYGEISTFYRGTHVYSGWMPNQQNFYNDHFSAGSTSTTPNVCGIGGSQVFMSMDASLGVTTKADWLTWLSNNNVTMYVILATPTDTQITDTTLITQLNSIHQFLTRYGYTGTVSGSLPLVINQTTLS